jgi:hypothetical protein
MFKTLSDKINNIKIDNIIINTFDETMKEFSSIIDEIDTISQASYLEFNSKLTPNSKQKLKGIVNSKKKELRDKFFKNVEIEIIDNIACSLEIYDASIEYFTFSYQDQIDSLGTFISYYYKTTMDDDRGINEHVLKFSKNNVNNQKPNFTSIFVKKDINLSLQRDVYKMYSLYSTILEKKELDESELKKINVKRSNDESYIEGVKIKIESLRNQITQIEEEISNKEKILKERADALNIDAEKNQHNLKKYDIPNDILIYTGDDYLLKKIKNNENLTSLEITKIMNAPRLLNFFKITGGNRKRPSRKTKRSSKKSKKTRRNNRKR